MVEPLVAGIVAGLVASVVLLAFMMPTMRGQPGPTQLLASKLTGRPPAQNMALAAVLHVAYGTFWGAMFGWGVDAWVGITAVGSGLLFSLALAMGIALWIVSATFWEPVTGMDRLLADAPPKHKRIMGGAMLGLHVIYAAVLAGVLWLLPLESHAAPLGSAVPAAGVVVLSLAIGAGGVVHGRQQRQAARGRVA